MLKYLCIFLLLVSSVVYASDISIGFNAPTTNADGTPISYFAGNYNIYYGLTKGNYSNTISIVCTTPVCNTMVVNLLPKTNYCLVATAVNTLDNESLFSNEICKISSSPTPSSVICY